MADPTPEELAAVGLYDPDDARAAERLELIAYLLSLGATVEELVEAADNLPQVASTRGLRGPGERLTQAEAAARAGMPVETSARIWRAAAFPEAAPDARIFTDEDVETLRIFQAGAALLGEAIVLQVVRVIGSSMERIADAMIAAFIVNVAAPSLTNDPAGLGLARANTEGTLLLRQAAGAMDTIFRRHVERLQRPLTFGDQRTRPLAVGFADLVGSTALAQQISIQDLATDLAEFDELASDVVVGAGGRVVKLIGDAVMYVVADPLAACDIALRLAETFSTHERLPPVRGGLAFGDVLSRDGDYFGPVVNLAARMAKLANPGSVLSSRELSDAVADYEFTPLDAIDLKGFDEPVALYVLSRPRARA